MFRIESLLSARLFIAPQALGDRIFFLSNLSGHISLYAMNHGGSVPEPLLPLILHAKSAPAERVFLPCLSPMGRIVVMLDRDGMKIICQ
jgi:hypothetical protein